MDLFSSLNSSVWFSVCDKTTKIKTQAGQYPLWPVSALFSIRSGQYPLWPVSAQASIRSGLYPHWPGIRSGFFEQFCGAGAALPKPRLTIFDNN